MGALHHAESGRHKHDEEGPHAAVLRKITQLATSARQSRRILVRVLQSHFAGPTDCGYTVSGQARLLPETRAGTTIGPPGPSTDAASLM